MNYKNLFLLIALALPFLAISQKKATKTYTNEFSVNVTSLLGNVLSINDNGSGSPYGISYRKHGTKQGIRISVDGSYIESDLNSVFNQRTESENAKVNARLGYERISALANNINIMYGIDLVGIYELENSTITILNDFSQFPFNQKDVLLQYGGGPSLKLQYSLNNRVSFFTESNLYFIMGTAEKTHSDDSIPDTIEDVRSLKLSMPVALFVSFAF